MDLSRKFHEIPFINFRNVTTRHDAVPIFETLQHYNQALSSLVSCFAMSCPTYTENFMKICWPVISKCW